MLRACAFPAFIINYVLKCTVRCLFTKLNSLPTQNAQILSVPPKSRRDEWSETSCQHLSGRKKTPKHNVDFLYERSTRHLNLWDLKHLLAIKLRKEINFCSQNMSLLTTWISFNFWWLWLTYNSLTEIHCQWLEDWWWTCGSSSSKVMTQDTNIGRIWPSCTWYFSNCRKTLKI